MKNVHKSYLISLLIFIIVFFVSCDSNTVYNSVLTLPKTGWNKDSVYNFAFTIEDASKPYDIDFVVRNSGNYAYQNLWLFVTFDGLMNYSRRDTVNLMLADDYGKWLGSGMGSIYTNTEHYRDSVLFFGAGTYRIKVVQAMREDILPDITEFGVKVIPHQKKQ